MTPEEIEKYLGVGERSIYLLVLGALEAISRLPGQGSPGQVCVSGNTVKVFGFRRSAKCSPRDFRESVEAALVEAEKPAVPGWSTEFGLAVVNELSSTFRVGLSYRPESTGFSYVMVVEFEPDETFFGGARLDPGRLARLVHNRLWPTRWHVFQAVGVPETAVEMLCSFCGRGGEVVISSPDARICDNCTVTALYLKGNEDDVDVDDDVPATLAHHTCGFCARRRNEAGRLFAGVRARICSGCTEICLDLLTNEGQTDDGTSVRIDFPRGSRSG